MMPAGQYFNSRRLNMSSGIMADAVEQRGIEQRGKNKKLEAVPARAPLDFAEVRKQIPVIVPDTVVRKIVEAGDPKKIGAIIKAAETLREYPDAFRFLRNRQAAEYFVRVPEKLAMEMRAIAAYASQQTGDPEKARKQVREAFDSLKEVVPLFVKYSALFINIAKDARKDTGSAYSDYHGKSEQEFVLSAVLLHGGAAVWIGAPLDIYHENKKDREEHLGRMSAVEVVSMLCSDPENFYTSSNHMMFDRLLRDMGSGKGVSELKKRFGLSDEHLRNFILRAINYGRMGDFVSQANRDADVRLVVDTIVGSPKDKSGIYSDQFDPKYLYCLANGLETIKKYAPGISGHIDRRMEALVKTKDPTDDQLRIARALRYIHFVLTGEGDREMAEVAKKSVFEPASYRARGVLNVVQIFDKEDTQGSHWALTQRWYGKPVSRRKTQDGEELVYMRGNARVTLFMGSTKAANADYVSEWIKKNNAGVITFRGHSYSLAENMPSFIFANKAGRYLYIPGSCGSAGSTADYIYNNPNTDLRVFGNAGTGRGQVTNALVDMIISQKAPIELARMLRNNAAKIGAYGGSTEFISAWSPGEAVVYYTGAPSAGRAVVASR